jgi:hypothetical protein
LRNGRRYRYTLLATDRAGNTATTSLVVTPGPRLLVPAQGALVTGPPLLAWTPVRHAKYYNLQLYRGGKKILSLWPTSDNLRLKRRWRLDASRYQLMPGRYRWYVWPGYGARAAARYGPVIGSRTFEVVIAGHP